MTEQTLEAMARIDLLLGHAGSQVVDLLADEAQPVFGAMVLAEGLFSVGINLEAVAANYTKFPNPVEALGTGIGEAANAACFASLLAVALGAALVARVRKDATLGS